MKTNDDCEAETGKCTNNMSWGIPDRGHVHQRQGLRRRVNMGNT
jgi:hypothetical protein